MSQATHLYFDHPYEPDPEERGFYWATRFTDTRKIFGFSPENLYAVAEKWQSGKPIRTVDFCGNYSELCTPLLKPENIVGMQGNLWTETVRTSDQLQYMIFPRLLALAERAWHKASWENIENKKLRNDEQKKDWERFANVLGMKEFTRLDKTGIKYRIPLPGAIIKGSNVLVNTAFPGLKVESSQDKKTWKTVTNKLTVTKKETKLYFRTKSADEKRTSRIVSLVAQMDKPNAAQLIVPINIIILLSLQFVALKQIV